MQLLKQNKFELNDVERSARFGSTYTKIGMMWKEVHYMLNTGDDEL